MSLYLRTGALLGAVLLGFLAGLFSFKIKSRWCPTCGSTLRCPDCPRAGMHSPQVQP
jgi:hypothetical protein